MRTTGRVVLQRAHLQRMVGQPASPSFGKLKVKTTISDFDKLSKPQQYEIKECRKHLRRRLYLCYPVYLFLIQALGFRFLVLAEFLLIFVVALEMRIFTVLVTKILFTCSPPEKSQIGHCLVVKLSPIILGLSLLPLQFLAMSQLLIANFFILRALTK